MMTTPTDESADRATLEQIAKQRAGTSPFSNGAVSPTGSVTALSRPKPDLQKASKPRASKEGAVKQRASVKKVETHISERIIADGTARYCVQIRRRVDGKPYSVSRQFTKIATAKAWRDRKLAEIELHGFSTVKPQPGEKVADILLRRLAEGRTQGRSARQNLQFLSGLDACQVDASSLTDLFDRYLSDHARPHKKAASLKNDERLISNRLAPVRTAVQKSATVAAG